MRLDTLVIFHKQLGDVLLMEPTVYKLYEATGHTVGVATRKGFAPLIALMPHARAVGACLPGRARHAIAFDASFKSAAAAAMSLAPSKELVLIQKKLQRPWHRLIFRNNIRYPADTEKYRARYYFDAVAGDAEFRPPQLDRPPDAWKPDAIPADYCVLHTTSAWKSKSWPAEKWVQTLDELARQGVGPFLLTGGAAEWERAYIGSIMQATRAECVDLSGRTGLGQYLWLIAHARLVLCIDGSATHIAAAFRRPAVSLFGPTHPIHWHWPAENSVLIDARAYAPERKPPTDAIPVSAVIAATQALLDRCR
ncbi:MAG: glycosyltransferase family 9 protein [Rhodocyclaceae bacterium]|nr:glycosyltransferase family 9 protein [Rhodocyclaceae bacterium]